MLLEQRVLQVQRVLKGYPARLEQLGLKGFKELLGRLVQLGLKEFKGLLGQLELQVLKESKG